MSQSIGELVSKQAVDTLVDELARAISDERCCMSRGRSTATIMQDILDLPAVTQKWIPVSERLPNLDDYTGSEVWQKAVLITGYLSFDDTKELFVSEAFAKDVICNCVPDTVVIAWMPLPGPYKIESEG